MCLAHGNLLHPNHPCQQNSIEMQRTVCQNVWALHVHVCRNPFEIHTMLHIPSQNDDHILRIISCVIYTICKCKHNLLYGIGKSMITWVGLCCELPKLHSSISSGITSFPHHIGMKSSWFLKGGGGGVNSRTCICGDMFIIRYCPTKKTSTLVNFPSSLTKGVKSF